MTTEDQLARIDALLAEVRALIAEDATHEPDPWPTAPLIVATLSSPSRSTKRLLLARNSNGDYVDGVRSALQEIDTLTNVVPVTVVPTAEWEAMATTVRSLTAPGTKGSLLNQAQALVKAAEALGLDT